MISYLKEMEPERYEKLKQLFLFGLVGGTGTVVNTAILYLLTVQGMHYLLAGAIATETAILWNFSGNNVITFRNAESGKGILEKFLSFQGISMFTIAGTLFILWILTSSFGESLLLVWNLIAILTMFLTNFFLNRSITWGDGDYASGVFRYILKKKKIFVVAAVVLVLMTFAVKAEVHGTNETGNFTTNVTVSNTTIDDSNFTDNSTSNSTGNFTVDTNETVNADNETENNETGDVSKNIADSESNQTDNQSGSAQEGSQNSTLEINSNPSNATITIDGTQVGNTPYNASLISGNHPVTISLAGYKEFSTTLELLPGPSSLNVELEAMDSNSTNNDSVVGANTNLGKIDPDTYHMFEDQTASFSIQLAQEETVSWHIDGKEITQTSGLSHYFEFNPGILYTGDSQEMTVRASGQTFKQEWKVIVENVINPFFSGLSGGKDVVGSPHSMVRVFTNNDAGVTKVNVLLSNGKHEENHTLIPIEKENETDWRKELMDMRPGNTYITRISTLKDGTWTVYELGSARAHYRNPSREPKDKDQLISSIEKLQKGIDMPELVYARFSQDVIEKNGLQEIKVDAKDFYSGVTKAEAVIRMPGGEYRVEPLTLTQGSDSYGTWTASMRNFQPGKYELERVNLWSYMQKPMIRPANGVSFYVVDPVQGNYLEKEMELVYLMLDQGVVKNGTNVQLSLDAADSSGLVSVLAEVTTSRGSSTVIPLMMKKGDEYYGTWEGTIKAQSPDTTYRVSKVTMMNKEDKRAVKDVVGRSFYVEAIPVEFSEGENYEDAGYSLFSREGFLKLFGDPLFPTGLAFVMMMTLISAWTAARKVRRRLGV